MTFHIGLAHGLLDACRKTICLEMSGNYTDVMELSRISVDVWKNLVVENCPKTFLKVA